MQRQPQTRHLSPDQWQEVGQDDSQQDQRGRFQRNQESLQRFRGRRRQERGQVAHARPNRGIGPILGQHPKGQAADQRVNGGFDAVQQPGGVPHNPGEGEAEEGNVCGAEGRGDKTSGRIFVLITPFRLFLLTGLYISYRVQLLILLVGVCYSLHQISFVLLVQSVDLAEAAQNFPHLLFLQAHHHHVVAVSH